MSNKISWRQIVNDKCKDCIYDPVGGSGTWRQQVADCTSKTCPIYPVRPMPQGKSARSEAIENES